MGRLKLHISATALLLPPPERAEPAERRGLVSRGRGLVSNPPDSAVSRAALCRQRASERGPLSLPTSAPTWAVGTIQCEPAERERASKALSPAHAALSLRTSAPRHCCSCRLCVQSQRSAAVATTTQPIGSRNRNTHNAVRSSWNCSTPHHTHSSAENEYSSSKAVKQKQQ